MAKNQNTYEKRQRENEKKRKAEEKRQLRRKKKDAPVESVRLAEEDLKDEPS